MFTANFLPYNARGWVLGWRLPLRCLSPSMSKHSGSGAMPEHKAGGLPAWLEKPVKNQIGISLDS
jgi:hypothetical protein